MLLVLAAAVLPAGCAVGPDYAPPAPPTVARLTNGAEPTATVAADTLGGTGQQLVRGGDVPGAWWTLFHSPQIVALVNEALAANPDLAAAQATLLQARQNARAALGALLPTIGAGSSATLQQISLAAFGFPGGGSPEFGLYAGSLTAGYTFDVFGGIRRQVEALNAQAEYQQYELEGAYLSLTGNLVTSLLAEASLQAQIAATRDIIGVYRDELKVTQQRFEAGGLSRADVLQQQASLDSQIATLPPLQKQLEQTRDQIAVYLGRLPGAYDMPTLDLASLTLPADLPLSLPSQLVAQRPDVRAYAALLHAATAEVGVALANMLPQFTFSADAGYENTTIAQWFTPAGLIWSVAGAISQPIFQGGTLLARKRAAAAAMQQAAAQYSSTVHVAFQNVADTLAALSHDAETLAAQLDAERAADASLAVSKLQFEAGAAPYLTVLQAQQSYKNALVRLVAAQAARFIDTVALFQALGGGWWHRSDVDPSVVRCCGVLP